MGDASQFLIGKSIIAGVLGLGGCLSIILGYRLFTGKSGSRRDGSVFEWKEFKVRVGSVGALLMVTACVWAHYAYQTVPKSFATGQDGTKITLERKFRVDEPIYVSGVGLEGESVWRKCESSPASNDLVCFDISEGARCGAPPVFKPGLGRLQVAFVRFQNEADRDRTAANHEKNLRYFLQQREGKQWSNAILSYTTTENEKYARRVVFNNVVPELEAPMCSWLRCEGWTFGPCQMVPAPAE